MTKSRDHHSGKRDRRNERNYERHMKASKFLIVTDGKDTEINYFKGLVKYLKEEKHIKIGLKPSVVRAPKLVDTCIRIQNKSEETFTPWIVFDRDQVKDFDDIIKRAEDNKINVAWSNPCFEIWMFAYFGNIPNLQTSTECCKEFDKIYSTLTQRPYDKNIPDIYSFLLKNGKEDDAIQFACAKRKSVTDQARLDKKREPLPSELCPCTMVDKLVDMMKKQYLKDG